MGFLFVAGNFSLSFAPLLAIAWVFVLKNNQLVVLALAGAFLWMLSIAVSGTFYSILYAITEKIENHQAATVGFTVALQEICRFVSVHLYGFFHVTPELPLKSYKLTNPLWTVCPPPSR